MQDDNTVKYDDKLYIPYGLNTQKEVFPGFGKEQIVHAAIGTAIVSCIGLTALLITSSVILIAVIIIIGILGSILFTSKNGYNPSVICQILNMVKFKREQQRYNYVYKHFSDS